MGCIYNYNIHLLISFIKKCMWHCYVQFIHSLGVITLSMHSCEAWNTCTYKLRIARIRYINLVMLRLQAFVLLLIAKTVNLRLFWKQHTWTNSAVSYDGLIGADCIIPKTAFMRWTNNCFGLNRSINTVSYDGLIGVDRHTNKQSEYNNSLWMIDVKKKQTAQFHTMD